MSDGDDYQGRVFRRPAAGVGPPLVCRLCGKQADGLTSGACPSCGSSGRVEVTR